MDTQIRFWPGVGLGPWYLRKGRVGMWVGAARSWIQWHVGIYHHSTKPAINSTLTYNGRCEAKGKATWFGGGHTALLSYQAVMLGEGGKPDTCECLLSDASYVTRPVRQGLFKCSLYNKAASLNMVCCGHGAETCEECNLNQMRSPCRWETLAPSAGSPKVCKANLWLYVPFAAPDRQSLLEINPHAPSTYAPIFKPCNLTLPRWPRRSPHLGMLQPYLITPCHAATHAEHIHCTSFRCSANFRLPGVMVRSTSRKTPMRKLKPMNSNVARIGNRTRYLQREAG